MDPAPNSEARPHIEFLTMQMPLDVTMPVPAEVQDVEVVTREFPFGQGKFEARHNAALSHSLLSGSLESVTSTGGRSRFEGTFLNDPHNEGPCLHGQGQRRNVDGSTYTGQWKDNQPDGHGEWRAPPPSFESYLGEWKTGKRHGFGIHKFANGDMYEGDWKNGSFHDRGKYTYANADQFSGIWEGGIKAHGSFYFRDGRISRRTYQNGRLMTCQDFDPRKRSYLPTITRGEAHDPIRNCYGSKQVSPVNQANTVAASSTHVVGG